MTPHDCDAYPELHLNTQLPGSECGGWSMLPFDIADAMRAHHFDQVEQAVTQWSETSADVSTRLQHMLLSARVLMAIDKREAGLALLRRALALGRESGVVSGILAELPEMLASLCAEALETGIEPGYTRCLIEHAGLRPPSPDLVHWPYPVRIYTLGQSTVVVRGQPLHFTGKAQRRPMRLLHCLLARGGRAMPVNLLRKAMGEDDESGSGFYSRGAFDMALSRLRQLLTVPDLVQVGDEMVSLNESLCWVDCWACEKLLVQVEQQSDPTCGLVLMERALALYEGEFLAGEDAAWVILARERIRSRLTRISRRLGQRLEELQRWEEAGALYERLRELFPVDEDLCLHLIRSHIKRGEFAQANGIYARCRILLAKVLGVLPSPALQALLEPTRI